MAGPQRLMVLSTGAWFAIARSKEHRFYKLSRNKKYLHYARFDEEAKKKADPFPGLNVLNEKSKHTTVILVKN